MQVWALRMGTETPPAYRRVAQPMTDAQQQSREDAVDEEPATDHLDDVEDGCGCTEIWEHLSENRDEAEADD